MDELQKRTIDDFGDQWSRYTKNEGYYGSGEMLLDITGPLLNASSFKNASVADIGSGSGRIVGMLLELGVSHVVSVEPSSKAFATLRENTKSCAQQITYLHAPGDELPSGLDLDFVFSIGVVHHIPNPDSTVTAAHDALKSGGKCLLWLYGMEGNETYLVLAKLLRTVTKKMPHWLLSFFCNLLNIPLSLYVLLCDFLPQNRILPMQAYAVEVLAPLTWHQRKLVIYDQLNPAYAKYYSREEALSLLQRNGFIDCKIYHRHGYSWTVIGTKP